MGILDRAKPIGEIPKQLIISLYSAPGMGKTITAAKTANKTILLTDERSHVSLSQFPELDVEVITISKYAELTAAVTELYNGGHPYDHLMIDTFDGIIRMKLREQRKTVSFNRGHDDINSLEDFNLLNNHMFDFISRLAMLPISVTVTSHDRIPDEKSYVKGDRLLRPSIPFRVFECLNGYANVVGYVRMRKRGDAYVRTISVQASDEYEAKNHLKMPPVVTDDAFVETIRNWKGI